MNATQLPARLTARPAPAARRVVSLLALAGAAALIWSSVIHLMLWSDGYRSIPVIGPLFLSQGIAGIALALAVVIFRRAILLAAGALLLAGTAAGLLLSAEIGLFGYQESLAVPYAATSLAVEFAGAALFSIGCVTALAGRAASRS